MAFFGCFGIYVSHKRVPDRVFPISAAHQGEEQDQDCCEGDKYGSSSSLRCRRYTWEELLRITKNFCRLIGTGGFSAVFLARLPDSTKGAIKVFSSSSERINQIYRQEVEILQRVQHENIVKFLGYCDICEAGSALVFEHVANGNLQEKLHGPVGTARMKGPILSWKSRILIAYQLARAIEYLHDKCDLQIVHGDIKASNILLDENYNCKLCDFGSAKMGFQSAVAPPSSKLMLGSPGYTDPHYLRTGIAYKKNDIYSFGVVILELITGVEALCSQTGKRLTSVAAPMLRDEAKVAEMVDQRLDGLFDVEEAKAMASISAMCLRDTPSLRPSAADILKTMRSKCTITMLL